MSNLQINSSMIDFTDDDIRKGAQGPRLPEGLHLFVVTKSEITVSDREKSYGNISNKLTVAALQDPSDVTSKVRPAMTLNVTLPFANKQVAGHQAPEWAPGLCAQTLRSVFDDLPLPPRREGEALMYNGEEIQDSEYADKQIEALGEVYARAKELVADPTIALGRAFYGVVGDNKGFWGIGKTYREQPEDMQLVDLSEAKRFQEVAAAPAPAKKAVAKKGRK